MISIFQSDSKIVDKHFRWEKKKKKSLTGIFNSKRNSEIQCAAMMLLNHLPKEFIGF